MDLSDYTLDPLHTDGEFILCRGRGRSGARAHPPSVLVVMTRTEHPRLESVRALEHEYSLRAELDPAWAVRPLELMQHEGRTALLLEDPGEPLLDQLLSTPMEIGEFLRVAVPLSAALEQVHARGLIHKNLKPANVMVEPRTGRVWLRGFGIASRLPRERQSAEPPEFIAGTLAYIAPEQTGRMNRSIDSRSDLYALGVTFYEMLTGSLLFTVSDPMEWVHCHIARYPLTPAQRRTDIPPVVSAIVMKLLAKTPEDRYQTAAGVKNDLCRCLSEWEAEHRIDDFPLGEHDAPDRLLIHEKLYGREHEVKSLLAAFDRVLTSGTPELVLVSGYSGIGKSAVVNELYKALVPADGLFAFGEFTQYKRDIPYAALKQAFQGLLRPLLGQSETELQDWAESLREALRANGRLAVELVPELALIVGQQPPIPELPPQEAQWRFQAVLRRFIGVFARKEHPLALFLDDLQWGDVATLDLLEALMQKDVRYLMLIGAYRDNEVNPNHPLMRRIESIRQSETRVTEITLGPLSQEDLGRLLADSLCCEPDRTASLAQVVHEKTAGNPFFAIQFISALAEEGLLAFDHKEARWSWDLRRIHAKAYTDNAVELMAAKLSGLSADTQEAIQELACLGSAEIGTLSTVWGASEEQVHARLWEAVRQEAVVRVAGAYAFVHNRVQEAAYSLIPEAMRAEAHLRIGRLLAAHIPPGKRHEAIFQIVHQLNLGSALIVSREEREQLAEFNLTAGQCAKASAAYASALSYFAAGTALLAEDAWERRPDLAFALELNRAECEFLTAKTTEAEKHLLPLFCRATNLAGKCATACLGMALYQTLGRPERAVEIGLEYLREVGIQWPPHPTDEAVREEYEYLMRQVGSRGSNVLNDLPRLYDRDLLATMEVLGQLQAVSYFTDMNLWSLVLLRMSSVSIEHGNSALSSVAYIYLNMILGLRFGDYETGYRLARVSLDLVEKSGLDQFKARTYLCYVQLIIPWTKHLRAGDVMQNRGLEMAFETGDLIWALFGQHMIVNRLFAAGDPLGEMQRQAEDGVASSQRAHFTLAVDVWMPDLGLIKTLRGLTPVFGSFTSAEFDETRFEQHLEGSAFLKAVTCWYWLRKLQASIYANKYEEALAAAERAKPFTALIASMIDEAEYHFFAALARAAAASSAQPAERDEHSGALAHHLEKLQAWTKNCPENFENRAALVGAELARVEDRELDAERLYEQAIRSARTHGFVQNEALAYELAARFYMARGLKEFAHLYLRNARHGYLRWGADGKVKQLDELYPDLRQEQTLPTSTSTIAAPVEQLDLATVIAVSQAISGEIVLEKLLDTVMRKAIEHAGAQRALLIIPEGDKLRIGAEALTDGSTVTVDLRDTAISSAELPESIVRYAARTQEIVILYDASMRNPFSADEYIRHHRARSILCLPLMKQGKLVALLYLENNLAASVFSTARIAVLRVLASEAAISLENTRLYHELAEREAKIRRLMDANIVGIFMWDEEGRILEANDEFLRMIGYTHEDVASGNMRWMDLTPPEWLERDVREWVPEIKRTTTLQPYEKEYLRKDGSRVPILIGAAAFDESVQEGVAFVLDITERKRAEQRIKYLADIVESTDDAVVGKTLDGKIVSWNRGAEHIYGYTAEEAVGQPVTMLIPPGCLAEFDDVMARLRGGEMIERLETQRMRKGGQIIDVSLTICPIRDAAGKLAGASAIARDITDRKRAEQALASSEKLFRAIAETVPMSIILWSGHDKTKTNAYFNPGIYRLSGYSPEELPNVAAWWPLAYPDPEYRKSLWDEWQLRTERAIATRGSIDPMEAVVTCKDGSKKYVLWGFVSTGEQNISFGIDFTERKRAEEALASSEKMFRAITETSPLALILTSEVGERKRMEYMNPTITRLFGYSVEEVGNLAAWWSLAYPDPEYRKAISEVWQSRTERAIATRGSIEPLETEVTCKDGSKKYVSWGFVSTGEQNICFGIDLTERKRAEDALRLSESHYRTVFETSLDGMCLSRLEDGRYIDANRAYLNLYGFEKEEIMGHTSLDLNVWADPLDRKKVVELLRRESVFRNFETHQRRKNGETFWVLASAALIELDGVPCALFVVHDISEAKAATEALRRLNRELRAISDCNQVLVRAADEQELLDKICRIVCDKAEYRMAWVGYAENDDAKTVRPVSWAGSDEGYLKAARIVWEDTDHGRGPIGIAIRTGRAACAQDFETDAHVALWREKALERGYRSCISLPLKDDSGTVFGAFTIYSPESNAFTPEEIRLLEELAEDMAFGIRVLRGRLERDRAENEIRQLNAELEERVRQRTAQLETVNKRLESVNKELESFSYSVSHDLRAPVRHISAYSRMLAEGYREQLPAEAQRYLDHVENSAQRMGTLIEGLLSFSRLGRQEMRCRDVALEQIVKDVVEDLSPDWTNRQVEWKIGALPTVQGEPVLLRQVFQNLIANALKFSRKRSPAIIEIGAIPQEGKHILFVRDNGAGFDMKYADKLFGVFQRLHRTDEFEGTGIGLATVQRIVQRHGGKVWAEGKVDEGATFFFTCP